MKTTNRQMGRETGVGIAAALEEISRRNSSGFDWKAFAASKLREKTDIRSLTLLDYLRGVRMAAVTCGIALAAAVSVQAGDGGSIAARWNETGPGSIAARWSPNQFGSIEARWTITSNETDATKLTSYQSQISDGTAGRVIDASAGLRKQSK